MRRYSETKAYKISYIILAIIVIIGILAAVLINQLDNHINEICEIKGEQRAMQIVTQALNSYTQSEDISDNDYINISYDSDEKINSIATDANKINALQTTLDEIITTALADEEECMVSIPIGTLSGMTLFSGRGFDIDMALHQVGAVKSDITSEFSSAGINQTKHTMYLNIDIELSAILPAH